MLDTILQKMTKIASELDARGEFKQADTVDQVIQRISNKTVKISQVRPVAPTTPNAPAANPAGYRDTFLLYDSDLAALIKNVAGVIDMTNLVQYANVKQSIQPNLSRLSQRLTQIRAYAQQNRQIKTFMGGETGYGQANTGTGNGFPDINTSTMNQNLALGLQTLAQQVTAAFTRAGITTSNSNASTELHGYIVSSENALNGKAATPTPTNNNTANAGNLDQFLQNTWKTDRNTFITTHLTKYRGNPQAAIAAMTKAGMPAPLAQQASQLIPA